MSEHTTDPFDENYKDGYAEGWNDATVGDGVIETRVASLSSDPIDVTPYGHDPDEHKTVIDGPTVVTLHGVNRNVTVTFAVRPNHEPLHIGDRFDVVIRYREGEVKDHAHPTS